MQRTGFHCFNKLKEEAKVWQDKVKILQEWQDSFNFSCNLEVTGTEQPPEDLLVFFCMRSNFGGEVIVVEKKENKTLYQIKAHKD